MRLVHSNGWDDVTAALQLLSHLDGDVLNVALLVPESQRVLPGFLVKSLSHHYSSPGRLAELGYRSSFGGACVIAHWKKLGQYSVPPGNSAWTVLIVYYICSVVAESFMASSRSSEMDQAGPSYAPLDPLPGTFLGLALDLRSDRLYNLAPDIPGVMGLWALWPSAAIVKVNSGRNAKNVSVVHNRGAVLIVESIFSGIWASTLPSITWNSHSCDVVRLCGARCGRGPLRTVLITCGGFIMFRWQ